MNSCSISLQVLSNQTIHAKKKTLSPKIRLLNTKLLSHSLVVVNLGTIKAGNRYASLCTARLTRVLTNHSKIRVSSSITRVQATSMSILNSLDKIRRRIQKLVSMTKLLIRLIDHLEQNHGTNQRIKFDKLRNLFLPHLTESRVTQRLPRFLFNQSL